MPTGGVEPQRESIRAWFGAGAAAAGIGSKLISEDLLRRRDWAGLERRVAEVLGWIREAREERREAVGGGQRSG
jgi:2-dehydro-3-deoxyphosphogluconate aldolase/(4S)-4-hydroxy-2-oxoglutarate aldolase